MEAGLIRRRAEAKADEVFATLTAYTEQPPGVQKLARGTFMLGWLHGREAGRAEALALIDKALRRAEDPALIGKALRS